MADTTPIVAVLTGDLIGSSGAGPVETNIAINRILASVAPMEYWQGNGPTYFTRMRGDGWQFILINQKYALRSSLIIFANLQSVKDLPKTRISIGIGPIDPLTGPDLSAGSGPAFEESGHSLDAMRRSDRFAISGAGSMGVTWLHYAIVTLIEDHISRWTPEQAEATAYYLSPQTPTLKEIAAQLGISTQAVHSRLKTAGAQALLQAVSMWENYTLEMPH